MIVGLTGGIGSGKTTVASLFEDFGIPIYIADVRAKHLMNNSEEIKKKIQNFLGANAYTNNGLNTVYVAKKVFSDKNLLAKLNNIVHPEVDKDFKEWYAAQESPYVIKEAAILFENGGYKKCGYIVLVTAPLEDRVERVIKRDKVSSAEVLKRINNQWPDVRKRSLSDAVINNTTLSQLEPQVKRIHTHLLVKLEQGW